MDAHSADNLMGTGFCLWVGADLTVHVAGGIKVVPQLRQLTEELEQLGEIAILEAIQKG